MFPVDPSFWLAALNQCTLGPKVPEKDPATQKEGRQTHNKWEEIHA